MTIRSRQTTAAALVGGASLAILLVGCSADTAVDTPVDDGSGGGSDSGASSGTYTDGDYSATGDYQSPGGAESIDVDVTLADGVVTEVTVTGNASGGNAERYQGQFEKGIAGEVVGKDIADLSVDKVAGSSLTSDGFNDAIEQIKADATA